MLNRAPQYAFYRLYGIPEIQDINIVPEKRRQGMASDIIKHCEALALAEGCAQIGISFGLHSSFGAAQRLYIKLGYIPDGFGAMYDRKSVGFAEYKPMDDALCLMLVKNLKDAGVNESSM
jgi:GNAT superfamily N-acetyltransferase